MLRSVGRIVRRGRWGVCPECRQGVERICRAISKQVQRSDAGIEVDVMHTWNGLRYRALNKGLYYKRDKAQSPRQGIARYEGIEYRALNKGLHNTREGIQGLDKYVDLEPSVPRSQS
jgi:hypothetical protein